MYCTGGGYRIAHDTYYPSRVDGTTPVAMNKQLILNASFSREDALPYRTNTTISSSTIADEYPESFFTGNKSRAAQMYDRKGSFYTIIESLRNNTSNGMIHGEVIDSIDTYSERVFLEELLKYCKETGVEVISKAQAYDICFNQTLEKGNLIYNPKLRNTAKEFLKDSDCVPANPDGYCGDCEVLSLNGKTYLKINNETTYLHYGIPLGNMRYSAEIEGRGTVSFYAIKNNSPAELKISDLEFLGNLNVNSDVETEYKFSFYIPDNPKTQYEQICAGLGDKIMGIKIVYPSGIELSNLCLEKVD